MNEWALQPCARSAARRSRPAGVPGGRDVAVCTHPVALYCRDESQVPAFAEVLPAHLLAPAAAHPRVQAYNLAQAASEKSAVLHEQIMGLMGQKAELDDKLARLEVSLGLFLPPSPAASPLLCSV